MKKKSKHFELVFRSFEETKTASGGGGGITPEGNVTLTENGGPYDVSAKAGAIVAVENEFKPLLSEGYKEFDISPVSFSTFYSTSVSKTMAITSEDIVSQLQVGDKVLLNGSVVYNDTTTIIFCTWGTVSAIESGQAQYTIAGMSQRRYGAYRRSLTANGEYNVNGIDGVIINVPNPSTGSLSITANGTYDVSEKAEAVVNVSGGACPFLPDESQFDYVLEVEATSESTFHNAWVGNMTYTTTKSWYDPLPTVGQTVMVKYGSVASVPGVLAFVVWGTVNALVSNSVRLTVAGSAYSSTDSLTLEKTIIGDTRFSCHGYDHVNITDNKPSYENLPTTLKTSGTVALTTDDLPSTLTGLRKYAFYNCTTLTGIENSKITSIGLSCFESATGLVNVSLPKLSTLSNSYCFKGCTALKTVDIPKVTTISAYNFQNCTALEWIHIGGTSGNLVTLGNTNAFTSTPSTMKIYVPDALVSSYKSASNWSTYSSRITAESQMPSA